MARAAIFLANLFDNSTVFTSGHNPASDLTGANVLTDLPGNAYEQWEGQDGGGSFEVTAGVDDFLPVNEGSGPVTTTIPAGWYATATDLADAIAAALNANSFLARTYTFTYSAISRRFQISVSAGGIALLTDSAPSRNILTILLGWDDSADTASLAGHQADHARSSTLTYVYFRTASGAGVAPAMIATLLDSVGGTDTSAATMYGDVTVYASTTYPGLSRAAWVASAALTLSISDRPSEDENRLQVAVTANATTYEHWAIFWGHVDDHAYHRIGIARGCAAVSSATRTVREVAEHDLSRPGAPLSLTNQHPVEMLSEWQMTVELERWEADEYRAWMTEAKRYGTHRGVVFALRWTDVLAGTLTAQSEADLGLLFYGSIRNLSATAYSGDGSDYMSGSMALGQLR